MKSFRARNWLYSYTYTIYTHAHTINMWSHFSLAAIAIREHSVATGVSEKVSAIIVGLLNDFFFFFWLQLPWNSTVTVHVIETVGFGCEKVHEVEVNVCPRQANDRRIYHTKVFYQFSLWKCITENCVNNSIYLLNEEGKWMALSVLKLMDDADSSLFFIHIHFISLSDCNSIILYKYTLYAHIFYYYYYNKFKMKAQTIFINFNWNFC